MSDSTHDYYVYIVTNPGRTVLYTGVTNDLPRRLKEHYQNRGKPETFAGKYYCHKLIYFEEHNDVRDAIEREKEIKSHSRQLKWQLVKSINPNLHFLSFNN